MSFVYPRTLAILRPVQPAPAGLAPYGGQAADGESLVAEGVPASIQQIRAGSGNPAKLPGDAKVPDFKILIPKRAVAKGVIKARDIVVDELGTRYQVMGPYWNSLGYNLTASLLQA
ncbi:hypothetical protein [Methylomagnum ishizawai]|uniref:hypothetical protein n=1 Tax=Methylomagnum ishizawai TaxID=1760988 RepID=UPI001C33CC6A|nr:hypothetical protein [Methylomagnum ishizawai]BBL73206.1 hypothetical protein MishRS11D_03040 [Methylomagnum ishizawai]